MPPRRPCACVPSWATCWCLSTWWWWVSRVRIDAQRSAAPWSSVRCARVGTLPIPEQMEVADLYLAKAASDLAAARALAADPDQQDDVVGFHAQQTVEKSIKAVLALRGSDIPRTHDLVLLAQLAGNDDDETPPELK